MKYDSVCPKNYLCEFEKEAEHYDALIERCKNCGKKIVYQKHGGKIDEEKYLFDHRRMTLQPGMKYFREIYGDAPLEALERLKERHISEQKRKVLREELRDRRISMHRRSTGHPLIKDDWKPTPFVKRIGQQKI